MQLVALALATVTMSMPVAAFATAASSDTTSLIVADPLTDYAPTEGGKLNGAIDGGTLMELAGTGPNDVSDALRDFTGEARTWQAADGFIAVAIVFDCGDEESAADLLRQALAGFSTSGATRNDSGIAGSAGFEVVGSDDRYNTVIWRQSKYYVQVQVASGLEGSSAASANLLAASQAALLQSRVGAEPTISTSAATTDSDETNNAAYRLGHLIGVLFVPGIVVLSIWALYRRRARRRAHTARFAAPPPVLAISTPAAATDLPPPPPPLT
jgi:hypothetical protein